MLEYDTLLFPYIFCNLDSTLLLPTMIILSSSRSLFSISNIRDLRIRMSHSRSSGNSSLAISSTVRGSLRDSYTESIRGLRECVVILSHPSPCSIYRSSRCHPLMECMVAGTVIHAHTSSDIRTGQGIRRISSDQAC